MKTSLEHLPGYKRAEIEQIVEIIRDVVHPEKIILFGSYATGSWVEDRYIQNGIRYEYISDYDFLVITNGNTVKEYILSDQIVNRARNITKVAVNPIIHDLNYVNEGLERGQYFFTDITKEGLLLFDNGERFAEPKQLSKEEQRKIAEGDFNEWFNAGSEFITSAIGSYSRNQLKISAFLLHQAAERFYNSILLVFTGYKPKTHSLEKLRQYAKPYSKELLEIFPENASDEEYHLFDLLKRGYIDARYKHDYNISTQETSDLIEKLKMMKEAVEKICMERIETI